MVKEKMMCMNECIKFEEYSAFMKANYGETSRYKGSINPLCENKSSICCFYDGELC